MYFEALHKKIKHCYLEGKRSGGLINLLMLYFDCQGMRELSNYRKTRKMEELEGLCSHGTADTEDCVTQIQDGEWKVLSSDGKTIYKVSRRTDHLVGAFAHCLITNARFVYVIMSVPELTMWSK